MGFLAGCFLALIGQEGRQAGLMFLGGFERFVQVLDLVLHLLAFAPPFLSQRLDLVSEQGDFAVFG